MLCVIIFRSVQGNFIRFYSWFVWPVFTLLQYARQIHTSSKVNLTIYCQSVGNDKQFGQFYLGKFSRIKKGHDSVSKQISKSQLFYFLQVFVFRVWAKDESSQSCSSHQDRCYKVAVEPHSTHAYRVLPFVSSHRGLSGTPLLIRRRERIPKMPSKNLFCQFSVSPKATIDYVGSIGSASTSLEDYVLIDPVTNKKLVLIFYYASIGTQVNPQYQITKAKVIPLLTATNRQFNLFVLYVSVSNSVVLNLPSPPVVDAYLLDDFLYPFDVAIARKLFICPINHQQQKQLFKHDCECQIDILINQEMKIIFLAWGLLLLYSQCIDFGSIVSDITNTASSAATTASSLTDLGSSILQSVQTSLNQMKAQATSLMNQAVGTIQNTSIAAIASTKAAVSSAQQELQTKVGQFANTTERAVDTAIETVQNQVNNIVSTIDNLSAQMCQSQCTSFFNLPCFLLFRCTDKIRNFCLAILLPIFIVIVLVVGCSTGLITPSCLCKTLMLISGITCLIWAIKRRIKAKNEQQQAAQKETNGQGGNPEECPQTEKVMNVKDEL